MRGITVKDYSSACHGSMWWCTALQQCRFNEWLPVHYAEKEEIPAHVEDLLVQVIGRRGGISVDALNFRLWGWEPADRSHVWPLLPPTSACFFCILASEIVGVFFVFFLRISVVQDTCFRQRFLWEFGVKCVKNHTLCPGWVREKKTVPLRPCVCSLDDLSCRVLFLKKFLYAPSVLLPALSFFYFVLFCEWRQISSSAVLRRSVLQGISWLIHRLEPVTHPSCTSCRTQRRCNPRFLGFFFFF